MSFILSKYQEICQLLINDNSQATIIAVSKTRPVEDIKEALQSGVKHFGETKVQEAFEKFAILTKNHTDMKLHMIGALQTNKVKKALQVFDFFHSLDRESLAREFSKHPEAVSGKFFFIQVNTGLEQQKSGIQPDLASEFLHYCLHDLKLNIVGLMCLPPINENPKEHFLMLRALALKNNLKELSIGMSSDYKVAIKYGATFIRLGSCLFGERK
jgi:hypothetical protein